MKPSRGPSFSHLNGLLRNLPGSELLLDRGSWDIVDTIRLLDALISWHLGSTKLAITNQRHSATAIGSLAGHCIDTHNHCNNATIQQEESKDTDSDNSVEKDLVLWFPLDVTIFIHLARHTCCTGRD